MKDFWQFVSEDNNKIDLCIDGTDFELFFLHNKDVFGADSDSRIVFAKMKDKKDPDHNPKWLKEANFKATNITALLKGNKVESMFFLKDLKKIEILSKDEAKKKLHN